MNRIIAFFGGILIALGIGIATAQTTGFPSRPIFQKVTVQTSGATSTDIFVNQLGAAANNRVVRLRNNGAGNFQMGAFNDALSTGNNFLSATFSGATPTIDSLALTATSVTVNGSAVAVSVTDSFSSSITGMAAGLTPTIQVRQIGNHVSLFLQGGDQTGTSNTTSMTMTGIPAAYRPASTRLVMCWVIDNTTLYDLSNCSVSSSGTITFGRAAVGGTAVESGFGGNFTNSGTKGIPGGWTITYPL